MKKIFLNLEKQPFANNFTKNPSKKKKKLQVLFDTSNFLVSLSSCYKSSLMFPDNYPYRSSKSVTILEEYKKLAKFIKSQFKPKKILEIGSNDGAFSFNFNKDQVICMEPCKDVSKITKQKGYSTINKYFDDNSTKNLIDKYKKFDVVFSANTITHIPNIKNVLKNLKKLICEDGILVIQEPSLMSCIKNCTYDQFYNEHIYVFSALSVKKIFDEIDMEIFLIQKVDVHGGSYRYFIKNKNNKIYKIDNVVKKITEQEKKYKLNNFKTYKKFSDRVYINRKKLIKKILNLKKKGFQIIGYGATAKAVTVINFCNLSSKHIDYFVDTTKEKQNKYIPGTDIMVKKYAKKLDFEKKTCYFLGAWNFKKEIFKKEKSYRSKGGRFLIHIPQPRLI